jgi:DtxR family Mn-dependent transcriptional regulator
MIDDLTATEREVLKAVWELSRTGAPAHTVAVAKAVQMSPATVTATVKRLAAAKLVEHVPYRGVTLTPDGDRAALAALRQHRVIERFLCEQLRFSERHVDELARRFEHHLPIEVIDAIDGLLSSPGRADDPRATAPEPDYSLAEA